MMSYPSSAYATEGKQKANSLVFLNLPLDRKLPDIISLQLGMYHKTDHIQEGWGWEFRQDLFLRAWTAESNTAQQLCGQTRKREKLPCMKILLQK